MSDILSIEINLDDSINERLYIVLTPPINWRSLDAAEDLRSLESGVQIPLRQPFQNKGTIK